MNHISRLTLDIDALSTFCLNVLIKNISMTAIYYNIIHHLYFLFFMIGYVGCLTLMMMSMIAVIGVIQRHIRDPIQQFGLIFIG